MDVDEFIDTYSDDVIYLHEARRALLTHSLRDDYVFGEYRACEGQVLHHASAFGK
jgi:hypothetical protein